MKDSFIRSLTGNVLVIIQFGCLAWLIFSGPVFVFNTLLLGLKAFSILILFWAIAAMRHSKLNVYPSIRKGAIFIARGPYRLIRHPMYLAVILFAIALLLERITFLRFILLIVLVINLLIKIEFEEKMLSEEFSEYVSYKKKTRKLFPFIY